MISSRHTNGAALYSMRVVARMTGLTPDTIRVWERRYQAVSPERTGGNARRYSQADVGKLQLLQEATALGHPIHSVAPLAQAELEALVRDSQATRRTPGPDAEAPTVASFFVLREEYLEAISRFEVQRAARLLHRAATLLNRDDFLFRVVRPILNEVGARWQARRLGVAEEHLVSAQLRALLQSDLRFASTAPGSPKIVVATPPGELHELGALLGALLAASRGFEPIYLGPNLPWKEMALAVRRSGAAVVLLGLLRDLTADEVASHTHGLGQIARGSAELWVGLPSAHRLNGRIRGLRYFNTFEALDVALLSAAGSP